MSSIYQLVHQTLEIGYLSLETENQLQRLIDSCCDLNDDMELMLLKQAIAFGHVKRQATELKRQDRSTQTFIKKPLNLQIA